VHFLPHSVKLTKVHDHVRLHKNVHVSGSFFLIIGNFRDKKIRH